MENTLDSALTRLRGFMPRKATPAGLRVTVEPGRQIVILIDPATAQAKKPSGAWAWMEGWPLAELRKYFKSKNMAVVELMDIAPVLV